MHIGFATDVIPAFSAILLLTRIPVDPVSTSKLDFASFNCTFNP